MNSTQANRGVTPRWRTHAVIASYVIAGGVGLVAGFDFGLSAGGLVIAVVASINAAVFLALICGGLAERLLPRR